MIGEVIRLRKFTLIKKSPQSLHEQRRNQNGTQRKCGAEMHSTASPIRSSFSSSEKKRFFECIERQQIKE
jgi:hypothetical protein